MCLLLLLCKAMRKVLNKDNIRKCCKKNKLKRKLNLRKISNKYNKTKYNNMNSKTRIFKHHNYHLNKVQDYQR